MNINLSTITQTQTPYSNFEGALHNLSTFNSLKAHSQFKDIQGSVLVEEF